MDSLLALLALVLVVVALSTVETKEGKTLVTSVIDWVHTRPKRHIRLAGAACVLLSLVMVYPLASDVSLPLTTHIETLIQEDNPPSDAPSETTTIADKRQDAIDDDCTSDD